MDYYKVDGHSKLVRDAQTNAILNTNMSEYNNYLKIKASKESEKEKINFIENDVKNIKNDLEEIKNLLRSLANGSW